MKVERNPWKGLDSYQESDRLYGRDNEIEELMSRIEYNVQTVLYSRTGIGKSSILKAGIFPKARQAGMLPVNIRLQHTTNNQETSADYIDQVKDAVASQLLDHNGRIEEVVPKKAGHVESLWEYLHRHRFYANDEHVVPLLVFDQFEEIFTLEKNVHRVADFFSQLADLLNGIMPEYLSPEETVTESEEIPQHKNIFKGIRKRVQSSELNYLKEDEFRLIFSLREDYLSYLERNTSRIPSMKLNRYCLLPINEEQAADIIMKPLPGLVDIDVAKLIIEKVTGVPDVKLDGHPSIFVDSAILSLYLSRLYEKMPDDAEKITEDLVNRFGDNIIQDFYLDAIRDFRSSSIEFLEDNLLNNEGRRENISVYNAKHVGHITDEELHQLCEEKRLIRRFYYGGDARIEFIHDILCPVVKDRRDLRQMLKAQEEEQRKLLEKEREKRKRLEEKAQAVRKRYRRWFLAGSLLLLFLVGHWLRYHYLNVMVCTKYYNSFILVNGWPVGVGDELSKDEASNLSVCYKLSKRGYRSGSPFREVEVMSSDNELLHNNKRTPLVRLDEKRDQQARHFSELLNATKYYKFSSTDSDGSTHVTKFEACDKDQRTLYVVSYFNGSGESLDETSTYIWAVYTDAKGSPLQVRDNGADRMQVFLNAKGQEEKYMFFDEKGAPKSNDLACFGYRMSYDESNRVDSVWGLDPFSNEEFLEVRSSTPTCDTFEYFDMEGQPIAHKTLNYHKRVEVKDTKGNIVEKEYFSTNGKHVSDTLRPSRAVFIYDEYNRVKKADYFDGNGQPYSQNKKYYARREYQYIRHTTELLEEKDYRWNADKQQMTKVYEYFVRLYGSVTEYNTDNIEAGEFHMRRIEQNEEAEPVSISYYGRDDKPMFDSAECFHKHIIERQTLRNGNKLVVHRYYDIDGSLFADVQNGHYAIDSCMYSSRNLLLSRVCFDRDTSIVKSQGYEYNDGIEVARYARGVHGTPIRCPKWERDGLCYYRLSSVKSSTDALCYVKPVSEYGCASWAYDGEDPYGRIERRGEHLVTDDMGSTWQKVSVTTIFADHIPPEANWVMYVHLLKTLSPADLIGLRDGDILLEIGRWHYQPTATVNAALNEWNAIGSRKQTIKVARYNPSNRVWNILTFEVPVSRAPFKAEIYPVYYTTDEYKEFSKVLAK